MAQIDQFLIFGASIELQTFETFSGNVYEVRDDARRVLLNMGSDLPFRNYGVGALTIEGLVSNLPGYLANHPNTDGMSAMVHIGGNDNSSNGAWSNWTEQQKIDFHDGLESVCQMITSAGIDLILCPLTYRLNTDPAELNENIIYPLIQQYSPDWWDSVAQKPLLDLYQISYDAGPEYFRDNVHTTYPYGTNALQEGVFGALNANADLPPWSGKKTISVNFCGDAERPAGTNNVLTQNATLSVVKDILGDVVDGATISFSGYTSLSGVPFPGTSHLIASDSLNYNAIARYTGTTSSSPCVISIDLGEEYAGRSGVIKITGARYSGSPSGNRWSVFEIDGVSSEINAEAIPPEQITLPLTMDENGTCIVNHTVREGGQFGYLSAFDLILDDDDTGFEITDSPESVRRGSSFSVTGTGITSEPTATLAGEPLSVLSYTATEIELEVPANTLAGHGSTVAVEITVGVDTDGFNIEFLPASGFAVVDLVSPVGGPGTIFEGMIDADTSEPISPVTGGQVIYSEMTSGGASPYPVTVRPDGWPEIDTGGATLDGSEVFSFQYLAPGEAISNFATVSLSDYLEPFEFTGSGGITVGGNAGLFHAFAATGSGGVTVGGSAEYSFPTADPFEFTGTGGLVFSGSADYSGPTVEPFDFTGSGGLSVGGSADIDTGTVTILPPSGLVVIIDTSDQVIQSADRPLDPYDTEWIIFAWDERIADAIVTSSEWVVPSEWNLVRTAQNQELSTSGRAFQAVNAALVDVNDAVAGRYVLSNRVSLSDGRQYERSVKIKIREM